MLNGAATEADCALPPAMDATTPERPTEMVAIAVEVVVAGVTLSPTATAI